MRLTTVTIVMNIDRLIQLINTPLTIQFSHQVKRVSVLALLALCAGCVSTSQPTSLYRLQPLAQEAINDNDLNVLSAPTLGVGRITVAEYLNRPQLLQSSGSFELQRSEQHRWAESLEGSIQSVVLENLGRLTGNHQLQVFPFRADNRPQWVLKANVLALDINADYEAELRVSWHWLELSSGRRMAEQLSRFSQTAKAGPSAQAKAYSQLLLQWSEAAAEKLPELK